jgi:hypothetical protein
MVLIGPTALLSPAVKTRHGRLTFSFVLISFTTIQFHEAQVIPFPTPPTLAPQFCNTRSAKVQFSKQWKSKAVGHPRPHFEGMNADLTLYIETVQIVAPKDNRILGRVHGVDPSRRYQQRLICFQ